MQIYDRNAEKPIRIREHPLQRSSSVSAIIHGSPQIGVPANLAQTHCNHYIDSLERFQRDYATADKYQRQNKRQLKQQVYERRRNLQLQRQNNIKKNEDDNVRRMVQRQYHSQYLHQMGAKRTANTESLPVNPINMQYDNNDRGVYQKYLDDDKKLNKLVRAHNLQTQGTSGYNVINGKSSIFVESLVPEDARQNFENKLTKFYSRYRVGPGAENL